jgi:hypothetical protein
LTASPLQSDDLGKRFLRAAISNPIEQQCQNGGTIPEFDVAHIRQQNVNLIIIPLNRSFRYKTPAQQQTTTQALQAYATSAGLKGTVVPVWDDGGRIKFLAPRPWHPFFRSINLAFVAANIKRRLTCP